MYVLGLCIYSFSDAMAVPQLCLSLAHFHNFILFTCLLFLTDFGMSFVYFFSFFFSLFFFLNWQISRKSKVHQHKNQTQIGIVFFSCFLFSFPFNFEFCLFHFFDRFIALSNFFLFFFLSLKKISSSFLNFPRIWSLQCRTDDWDQHWKCCH